MNAIVKIKYENIDQSFDNQGWFNATEAAKRFDKEPYMWLRQRDTVEYMVALARYQGKCDFMEDFNRVMILDSVSALSQSKLLKLAKRTGLVRTKSGSPDNGGGTWLHPKLAITFARWLNIDFAIWCDLQIDNLIRTNQAPPSVQDMIRLMLLPSASTWEKRFPDSYYKALAKITNTQFNHHIGGSPAIFGDITNKWVYRIIMPKEVLNAWSNNVLTFGGTTRKTFTVIRAFTDINNFQVFTGCHINQWNLTIPDSGIVSSKFSLMGLKRTAYQTAPTGTVTPAVDAIQFTALSTGDILIDGQVRAGVCVTQLDMTVDNSMQIQKCLNYENNIGAILETIMKVTGNITIAWSTNTAELYEKQFLNQPIGLSYTLKDSAGNKYVLNLPKVLLTAPLPSGSSSDILNTQFTFSVADVAPKLTRIPIAVTP